jgi:hypothetical protein
MLRRCTYTVQRHRSLLGKKGGQMFLQIPKQHSKPDFSLQPVVYIALEAMGEIIEIAV